MSAYPIMLEGRRINALVVAVSSAIGPTVASGILLVANWPWLFAVNVPLGVAAFAIATRALPANRRGAHRFDVTSAALNALTFGLLIVAIGGLGHGERRGLVALELVAGIAAGLVLVRRQLSLASPLLPVDLLACNLELISEVATTIPAKTTMPACAKR